MPFLRFQEDRLLYKVSAESLLVILAKSCCLCYTLSRIGILMFYERYPSWSWSFARFTIM